MRLFDLTSKALLNDEIVYAWELKKTDRGLDFRCPICQKLNLPDELITVMGDEKIWHFRHKNSVDHGHEAESQKHLEMKKWVKENANSLGYDCELEVMIFNGNKLNITDAVIYVDNKWKIAVECQRSSISNDEYLKRNENYVKNNYHPWWILGGNRYGSQRTKLEKQIASDYNGIYYYSDGLVFNKLRKRWRGRKRISEYNPSEISFKDSIGNIIPYYDGDDELFEKMLSNDSLRHHSRKNYITINDACDWLSIYYNISYKDAKQLLLNDWIKQGLLKKHNYYYVEILAK